PPWTPARRAIARDRRGRCDRRSATAASIYRDAAATCQLRGCLRKRSRRIARARRPSAASRRRGCLSGSRQYTGRVEEDRVGRCRSRGACGPHHEEAASMLAITRRALAVGLLTVLLAACKVVPDGGRPGPQPIPTPDGPSEDVLPTDTARHRVALLVPLSGNNAAVGRSIANATTMALLDTNADNLRITTYDTATGAGTAAARAISDGNKLILGPLLREDVSPVLTRARPAGVPLVTFSNDTSTAEPDVFVMGHVPEQSIARTVGYARSQGARRFAALIPDGDYGRRAADALSQSVGRAGGTLVATERY